MAGKSIKKGVCFGGVKRGIEERQSGDRGMIEGEG